MTAPEPDLAAIKALTSRLMTQLRTASQYKTTVLRITGEEAALLQRALVALESAAPEPEPDLAATKVRLAAASPDQLIENVRVTLDGTPLELSGTACGELIAEIVRSGVHDVASTLVAYAEELRAENEQLRAIEIDLEWGDDPIVGGCVLCGACAGDGTATDIHPTGARCGHEPECLWRTDRSRAARGAIVRTRDHREHYHAESARLAAQLLQDAPMAAAGRALSSAVVASGTIARMPSDTGAILAVGDVAKRLYELHVLAQAQREEGE